ncbi:hypothetical protein BDR07DRAFT_1464661 [Suillus spraguei]|nr:hypothetical protein BDR07DRAFT_1464661 [Suillus spraguei]
MERFRMRFKKRFWTLSLIVKAPLEALNAIMNRIQLHYKFNSTWHPKTKASSPKTHKKAPVKKGKKGQLAGTVKGGDTAEEDEKDDEEVPDIEYFDLVPGFNSDSVSESVLGSSLDTVLKLYGSEYTDESSEGSLVSDSEVEDKEPVVGELESELMDILVLEFKSEKDEFPL